MTGDVVSLSISIPSFVPAKYVPPLTQPIRDHALGVNERPPQLFVGAKPLQRALEGRAQLREF